MTQSRSGLTAMVRLNKVIHRVTKGGSPLILLLTDDHPENLGMEKQ